MGDYDGNTVAVIKDFAGRDEKSELEAKADTAEDEPAEQISSNEPVRSKDKELSRKHRMEQCEETEDVLSSAYISHPREGSERCRLSSSPTSSETKKRSGDLLDDLMQKRQRHHMNSNDLCANLNMRKLIADRIDIQKQERSGSSGKRSRDSFDSETRQEGEAVGGDHDSVSKRRKVRHACDSIHLKMLGPLKFPDYVNGLKYDHNLYPEIIKLNKKLIEINKKLRAGETIDNCLEDEHSPSPPPIYNEIGIRVNTRVNRLRKKLGLRRQQIICELNQKNPLCLPQLEEKPAKFSRKLYIPVKQYPYYNFIGLIIGPRGHTQKRMERESGARILLRGKGSTRQRKGKQYKDRKTELFEDEDLHVYIEAEDEKSLESASEMVEKLLVPVNEELNEHKHAQLRELAELNSEISSEALNCTTQNKVACCYTQDDEKPITSLFPMKPTNSVPAPEIENNSHQSALVSFLHCMINPKSGALISQDIKLDSTAGTSISLDAKPGDVINKAKLFVGFLPMSVNTEKLIELFLPFGRLCEAVVIINRRTGLSKGYGFVKYLDPSSAAEALVQMDGFKIDGKIITVRIAGRAPLNVNTIIGPRALRFANPQNNLVSAATCPSAFSQGVTKGWNNWVLLAQPNAFPLRVDSMYRRPHVFTQFSEQCPVGSSVYFSGQASSIGFLPFPCYQNVANSLD